MKHARTKCGTWLPIDHAHWAHEAASVHLMYELKALGWEFWS